MIKSGAQRLSPAVEGKIAIAFLLMPFVSGTIGFLLFPLLALTTEGRPADMLDGSVAFGLGIGIASLFVTGSARFRCWSGC